MLIYDFILYEWAWRYMIEVKCFGVMEHGGRGLVFVPFLAGAARFPRLGTRLIETGPTGQDAL